MITYLFIKDIINKTKNLKVMCFIILLTLISIILDTLLFPIELIILIYRRFTL